jgi:hypothetical protein
MTRFFLRLVPEREAWLPEMRKQIPQLEVVRDLTRDSNETFFLALMESEGEPAVHLEDDVQLTSDFLSKIEPVIAAHPDHVVQFFSLRKSDAPAMATRSRRIISVGQAGPKVIISRAAAMTC